MLNALTDLLSPALLLALLLLSLGLLVLVGWAAWRGAARERQAQARPAQPAASRESLTQSFRRAVERIETHLAPHADRYRTSWTLVLNVDDGVPMLPLAASGIPSALVRDDTLAARAHGLQWNFFDKGVAIQVQGNHLGDGGEAATAGEQAWDHLLGLCRRYRPERPFDAVVLVVPASLLVADDPQAELDVAARAKAVHQRLWLAQNRFAMQFPVYLAVSGCETVPGFTAFGRALPEALRRSMLGWSSPFELTAPFQPAWIDTGFDTITRDVQDACAELCALELAGADSAAYFMLPTQLESLRRGTRLFVEELMRPNAYHEPFLFRGFYLTGDGSDAAALRASADAPAVIAPGVTASAATPADVSAELPTAQPLFLRDLFEQKIFAEPGLVRASRAQHLQRPLVRRAVRWTAVALPAFWAVGLALYTVRLAHLAPQIVSVVQELDQNGRVAGEPVDLARERARVLNTLALMERMQGTPLGAVFMPGSWSVFDDLQARLHRRLERGVADNALEPLRLGAYARLSELTGVPTDPASGTLIAGSGCTLPPGWAARVQAAPRSGLDAQDLPEFPALLDFVARLEELDRGVRALERLTHTQVAASGEDLRLVVLAFLGAEVGAQLDRSAAVLRRQARIMAPLALETMQRASVCTLQAGMRALHTRLFERNELLLTEQGVDTLARSLVGSAAHIDRAVLQRGWSSILEALSRQEALMLPGHGSWMREPEPALGEPYDTLLQRMQGLVLVGPAPVAEVQQLARQAFERFRTQWDPLLKPETSSALGAGLQWQEKEGRWGHTPERVALRDGLNALIAQAALKPGHRALPAPPPGQAVTWDRSRLDQALATADLRRKFEAEVLPRFPAAVRDDVDAMVRSALADGVVDALAQALLFVPPATAPAVAEADRLRLARALTALNELGARGAAARLGQILAADALVRLRRVDDTLQQGDVYRPRDSDFRSWSGEKSPMLSAFGAGDAAGLSAYAATQQAFVDGLAREAEALLPALEGQGGAMVQRWRGITGDLARYRLKSPASSLAQLESFVLVTAADADLLNCADRIRPVSRRAGDFFAEQLGVLQSALSARCLDLQRSQGREAWGRFAEAFNRDLAGRSPFHPSGGGGAERPPADPQEVGVVLQAFESAQRLLAATAPKGGALQGFADQMERVRAFMAPLYPAQPETVPGYDLSVEFRANAAHEQHGNKVIDWTLVVGSQTLRAREPPRPLRWEPGMPLEVRLRLARDGPVAPQTEPGQPALVVEAQREVRYRYGDPWALYSLIKAHRDADPAGRLDPRSQLLRFEFPLVPAGTTTWTDAQEMRARLFVRIAVSPAARRAPLAWPGIFPIRAPQWSLP